MALSQSFLDQGVHSTPIPHSGTKVKQSVRWVTFVCPGKSNQTTKALTYWTMKRMSCWKQTKPKRKLLSNYQSCRVAAFESCNNVEKYAGQPGRSMLVKQDPNNWRFPIISESLWLPRNRITIIAICTYSFIFFKRRSKMAHVMEESTKIKGDGLGFWGTGWRKEMNAR